ncbi:hypothetical protein M430DRAFT_145036 [Amorphotheca resinae ATCC 22711]|uniref:FAD-binding domain-containing protein n=1 Tax=Amorphotheca resinae ATCC 22711 TaxID=857342 RepID=A0A2T3AVE2_AMORE|nr:hypothetical protein M430DRAFT_145036 [Amorphotheca resinae ATCC 22711]PSS12635.1 hypothetical protein M430DRAFT_145036 [Amorphotheca resinae ATCC 22711]
MSTDLPPLRVAIVGGGPGGLGAAIALSSLPNVSVTLFEQARELREIGAGIRIGLNCWKVLELLGADQDVKGHVKEQVLHRNGLSGELIATRGPPSHIPYKYYPQRVRRTRLQFALLSKVPKGIIQLRKRLVSIENLDQGVRLRFEDGTETTADLVVGGDGIRSVIREQTFPGHTIQFTGTTIWRVLIPQSSIAHIPEIPQPTTWWYGRSGHVYLSPVDYPSETSPEERMFEISVRNVIDPATETGKRFSWGIPVTNERVESFFQDYDPRIRETLASVPDGHWKEFSAFAGPRLKTLIAWDKVVLIGDASHPLSGAFGSGAAFALEDGWILARALEHTRSARKPLSEALKIFDEIRSPYYLRMYEYLDEQKRIVEETHAGRTFEERLQMKVDAFVGEDKLAWIYENDIEEVWKAYLRRENEGEVVSRL